MSTNTYNKIKWTEIRSYPREGRDWVPLDSAVRVYKSAPGRVTLQVRGPLRKKTGGDGKYGIIANAHMDAAELTALRDGINTSLAELSS